MGKVRLQIGVLAGWHVYSADAPDQYLLDAYRGIAEAAAEHDCDVLFACGLAPSGSHESHPALPFIAQGCRYTPIGTFNADGLILLPPFPGNLSSASVNDLVHAGKPVVFLGQPGPGPSVISDAESGLANAVTHLKALGHTDIAFVAGSENTPVNYSTHRLAFDAAMTRNGLSADPGRVAYGHHTQAGGYAAMQSLLVRAAQRGERFSAVIVDGDESMVGAMHALRAAGLRVPGDVAVIAYCNSLQAQAHTPSVSALHQQVDEIGRQATRVLVQLMTHGQKAPVACVRVPERLIVRESCGAGLTRRPNLLSLAATDLDDLARHMADQIRLEADPRSLSRDRLTTACRDLASSWQCFLDADAEQSALEAFLAALVAALNAPQAQPDSLQAWHAALSLLFAMPLSSQQTKQPSKADRLAVAAAIHHAHLVIAQHSQQKQAQRTQARLQTTERMAMLSARLLAAKTDTEILEVTTNGLQQLGARLACIALLDGTSSDAASRLKPDDMQARLRYAVWTRGEAGVMTTWHEATAFPPAPLDPQDGRTALLVIPFDIDGAQAGFVAFGLECIELGGAIVHQVASAIRSSRLYEQLTHARAAVRAKRINPSTRALVQRAMAYIHAHYANETTRDRIAAHVGIHSDYLTYIFRCETGLTPIAYLNRFRVEQACRMIENGTNITEVALAVGFTDLSYFSRVFRRQLGMSPQRFRQARLAAKRGD